MHQKRVSWILLDNLCLTLSILYLLKLDKCKHCCQLQVFVTAHQSVADVSKQMLQELKRHNYVTPTNYLETVRGYRYLIAPRA